MSWIDEHAVMKKEKAVTYLNQWADEDKYKDKSKEFLEGYRQCVGDVMVNLFPKVAPHLACPVCETHFETNRAAELHSKREKHYGDYNCACADSSSNADYTKVKD
jgi:hypothetical protein